MDVSHILDSLNDEQRHAVANPSQHLLVLAGAGSGKTRVLVHRIAWLLEAEQVSPFSILAVTFTNKAAREMRHRIESLMGQSFGGMWVGTFHGLAHRLLRTHWQEAGLIQDFQILDSDDQLRLIKRINRELQIDDERWPAKQCQWYINSQKDEGLRASNIDDFGDDLYTGSAGFDWVTYKDHTTGVAVNLGAIPPVVPPAVPQGDAFDANVEAASGSQFDDVILGDNRTDLRPVLAGAALNPLDNQLHRLTNPDGTDLVAGLWSGTGSILGGTTATNGLLGTATNAAGGSAYPFGAFPSVSVKGLITAPGTRTYQVWYRNAAAFCTASTFNLSNGVSIVWHL